MLVGQILQQLGAIFSSNQAFITVKLLVSNAVLLKYPTCKIQ
jgi:hypothetical protein